MIDEETVKIYTYTLMSITIIAIGAIAYPIYGYKSSVLAILITVICIGAVRYSVK